MFLGITESPKCLLLNQTKLRLTRRVSLVEKELLTLPEHLSSSPPVFGGIRVTQSLVLYVCFVDRCLSFCTFSFGHCVVCSSSIYGFFLSLYSLWIFEYEICGTISYPFWMEWMLFQWKSNEGQIKNISY